MKKRKILLNIILVGYISIAYAFNFTECRLEHFLGIKSTAKTLIAFTEPYDLATRDAPVELEDIPIKSNLPSAIKPSTRNAYFNLFDINPDKQLINHARLQTAWGSLEIEPWFFTNEQEDYYTGESDKIYTKENYIRPTLPRHVLNWRAVITFRGGERRLYSMVRIAECRTDFGMSFVPDQQVGVRLTNKEFLAMFPRMQE
jgi:hypothetical protein